MLLVLLELLVLLLSLDDSSSSSSSSGSSSPVQGTGMYDGRKHWKLLLFLMDAARVAAEEPAAELRCRFSSPRLGACSDDDGHPNEDASVELPRESEDEELATSLLPPLAAASSSAQRVPFSHRSTMVFTRGTPAAGRQTGRNKHVSDAVRGGL